MTAEARACRSVAARALASDLDRRAGLGAKGAEHAEVAGLGPQHGTAALAVIEELTGVGRHRFRLAMAALRTGDRRTKVGAGIRHNGSPPTAAPRQAGGRQASGCAPSGACRQDRKSTRLNSSH